MKTWAGTLALLGLPLVGAGALSPADLHQQFSRSESVTLIDIRPTARYQAGHIPGAINIPETLLPARNLPPLGRVVVYGSGLGLDSPEAAARVLEGKPGVRAEVLEGGFAAWEMTGGPTTRPRGLGSEELPYITFDQLKKNQRPEMILVDLRRRGKVPGRLEPQAISGEPLTDLPSLFPNVGGIATSPSDLPQRPQSTASSTVHPLLVLIDNGDGVVAQETARALRAAGNRRVVVLAGGERTLARGGKTGLQRQGGSLGVELEREGRP